MSVRLLPALLLVAAMLGGCVGQTQASPAAVGDPVPEAEPATFGESTGAIAGVVVDDSLQPIASALVGLKDSELSTLADAAGRFTFSRLDPGTYTVLANALGYESKAQNVEVAAGSIAEIRFVLTPLPTVEPYVLVQTFSGLIECGWGVSGAGSGNCLPIQFLIQQFSLPNPTNTRIIGLFPITDHLKVKSGVFEMTWSPSAATTSGALLLAVELEGTGVITGRVYGSSQGANPLRVETGPEPFKDLKPEEKKDKVQTRTFPAGTTPPTFVVNQRFTVYASACYEEACPDTYTALKDA